MLGIGALFLLFVLLYSQRVASQSGETLGELLHHPMPGVSRHSLIWAVLVCAPLKAMVFQPIWCHKFHSSLELVMKKRGFFPIIDKTINKSPSKNMFRATVQRS